MFDGTANTMGWTVEVKHLSLVRPLLPEEDRKTISGENPESQHTIISPAEKKIRSALERIASYNVRLDGTTRREMENVRYHCKPYGVDSEGEIPPSFAPCFQTEEDKRTISGGTRKSIASPDIVVLTDTGRRKVNKSVDESMVKIPVFYC
ncbi:hypothetical protein CDAR_547561 [Caerostris darwini]|uniref:Uncharacterized protein n=1 Tax=Caerostris darwini TaxID=1538125 RepID=A0AAV4UAR6_9ARAC|nr:hypothetical protein CDAR_547561 [Caerostris darwini]